VAEAVADPACRRWVEQFWDEAQPHLALAGPELAHHRAALLERYANPRIRHHLAQIATDGSLKLPVRVLPVLRAERAAGRVPIGGAAALAGWVLHLRGAGAPVADVRGVELQRAAAVSDLGAALRAVVTLLDPDLGADEPLLAAVRAAAEQVVRR
jgi:fructuronate reductase